MHKNKKIKLAGKKYRIGQLMKMSEEELQEIWVAVQKEIGEEKLDWLWFQYKENLKLAEQGLPYGTDITDTTNAGPVI